ncbi:MAG: 1,4-alpha-glucan branching protein, partial [Candidatus Sericytochromatia bacterium]
MSVGTFSMVLHSHLPYYRKAGMWPFGEENLYEAIAETYLPLLNALNELLEEGIAAKLTVGITPVLAEQLADEHLKEGFEAYVEAILARIELDRETYAGTTDPRVKLADYYHDWYSARLSDFQETYDRDPLAAFKRLQDAGAIEIITSAATHCFSPLLSRDSSLAAQFEVGVEAYKRHFGRAPQGIWLPECAYRPGIETEDESRPPIEQFLAENGLEYFFTDAHAVVGGKTAGYRRHIGLYGSIEYVEMPERPLSGLDTFHGYWLPEHPVAVYARNERAGWQV